MDIHLNGKATQTQCRTLMELIENQGVETESLVVEHNLAVVRQVQWKETRIQDGDTIELLSFVGGG